MRRLRNPLVIFASQGDNITPPHQALGWIPELYGDRDAIVRAGQRIVYLLHDRIGHLGIFVSAAVAEREHQAILASLPEIEALAPGLYEMCLEAGAPGVIDGIAVWYRDAYRAGLSEGEAAVGLRALAEQARGRREASARR